MCGIAGLFAIRSNDLPSGARAAVDAALNALSHRGPDDCRVHASTGSVIGHRRLAILDPEGGLQPFQSNIDSSVIAYNGELYGFDALRTRLAARAPFFTRSDTEVMLRQLTAAGISGLDEVNGMYAFAYVDSERRGLTLAIDPVGIKPLYMAVRPDWVAFASELGAMRALLERMGETPTISKAAISRYLSRGWIDAPLCVLNGVSKFLPGEVITFGRDGQQSSIIRSLPTADLSVSTLDDREILTVARDVLGTAVRDQLLADVPVGLFLSGGLDSSLLLAIAASQRQELRTFSIGFRELGTDAHLYDESGRASRIAAHFKTAHRELQLTAEMVFTRLNEIALSVDDPIADPAVIPLFFLAEFASKYVKAALTGDGGDELFGGYQHHRLRSIKAKVQSIPAPLRLQAERSLLLAARAADVFGRHGRRIGAGLRLVAEQQISPPLFLAVAKGKGLLEINTETELVDWGDPDSVFLADMAGPLAGGMLQKTDRVTMRHGIEARVPLLDDRVLRFARGLPWRWKVRGGSTKFLLRQLLSELAPPEVSQAGKRGFRVPLGTWFRTPLNAWITKQIGTGSAVGDSELGPLARELLADHSAGACDHGQRLWALAILEPWLRIADGRIE